MVLPSGPEIIKIFSCINQQSMIFQKLIQILNTEKDKFFPCLVLIWCNNPAHKCSNANNCWHFNIYEQDKYHELSMEKVL